MKTNWYRRLENLLEPVVIVIAIPIMLTWMLGEWFCFNIKEKIREKVARSRE